MGTTDWRSLLPVGPYFDACPTDLKDAMAQWFLPADWEAGAKISHCESKWNPGATLDTRGFTPPAGTSREYSVGPWQINLLVSTDMSEADARSFWWATKRAAQLRYSRGNWYDWCNCAFLTANGQCPYATTGGGYGTYPTYP